jgi:hypothetical protein
MSPPARLIRGLLRFASTTGRERLLMSSPPSDPELFEASRALIAESRRAREKRDALWQTHLTGRDWVSGHGLSFLGEAKARLDARETARDELAHRAVDRLF